jgi:lipopolysaccharide heptosyltransferase I
MSPERDLPPRSILIVKLSAIGDVIQTLPMANALRTQYPDAAIDWVVEEDASAILLGHPALNRVIISRRKRWQGLLFRGRAVRAVLREMAEFLRDLRSREYEWVIDNHGIFKSGLLVALSRGRRKIGFARSAGIADEGNYLFTNERYKPLSIDRHAVERYLDLISQVGVPAPPAPLEYLVPPGPRKRAEELLAQEGFSHPVVVIHPMAKWATKQWAPENFARLISALREKKVFVVVTGSPGDGRAIMEILGRIKDSSGVLNLAGKTDLAELAGFFSLCDLVVTPDTGPMHLAASVKAPLIALFGPTAPWRTGPYGKSHLIFRKALACSPCFRKTCSTVECMKSITVEEVLDAACTKLRIGS